MLPETDPGDYYVIIFFDAENARLIATISHIPMNFLCYVCNKQADCWCLALLTRAWLPQAISQKVNLFQSYNYFDVQQISRTAVDFELYVRIRSGLVVGLSQNETQHFEAEERKEITSSF